jgi:hypothetical protein
MIRTIMFTTMTMAVWISTGQAQLVEKKALTLHGAKKIAAAAEAKAKAEGARVVIAVVDEGGNLLLLERLDDTLIASINVGIDKHVPLRPIAGPVKSSKIKSRMGACRPWRCTEPSRCKAVSRLASTAKSSPPSA